MISDLDCHSHLSSLSIQLIERFYDPLAGEIYVCYYVFRLSFINSLHNIA